MSGDILRKTLKQLFDGDRMAALNDRVYNQKSQYWKSVLIFVEDNWDVRVSRLKTTEAFWILEAIKDLDKIK